MSNVLCSVYMGYIDPNTSPFSTLWTPFLPFPSSLSLSRSGERRIHYDIWSDRVVFLLLPILIFFCIIIEISPQISSRLNLWRLSFPRNASGTYFLVMDKINVLSMYYLCKKHSLSQIIDKYNSSWFYTLHSLTFKSPFKIHRWSCTR